MAATTNDPARPRVAVHKFSSCDGCQLAFLNLGADLLTLAERVELVHFAEAGPLDPDTEVDVSFVEGSVSTPEDLERIRHIRAHSKILIAIGACATSGGIQGLRNGADTDAWTAQIYEHPEAISSLERSTPIADHVRVDFEIWGCPINSRQMLAAVNSLLLGVVPRDNADKVCTECKRLGHPCVMVTRGIACMGPVTRAGCGALCPGLGRDCYGTPTPTRWQRSSRRRGSAPTRSCGASSRSTARRRPSAPPPTRPGAAPMTEQNRSVAIHVPVLARVEGEGALDLRIEDGDIRQLRLRIFEPPRYFEKFVEGRSYTEIPDMVARICGICPVAYQVTAAQAFEKLFGVELSPWAQAMRRVFYCGEWIQSHAPDFFGCGNAIELAKIAPEEVRRGLAIQGLGNELMDLFGARSVHPVGVRIGGFHGAPSAARIRDMRDRLRAALPEAEAMVRWAAAIPLPPDDQDFVSVGMRRSDLYAIETGDIAVSDGNLVTAADFDAHFAERHVPHSTALFSTYHGQPYLVGPLARLNLNADRLPADIRALRAAGRGRIRLAEPQRLPEPAGARGRDPAGVARGLAPAGGLPRSRFALDAGHAARWRGHRLHRGAARPAVAPLRGRRRRSGAERAHRAADQPEPGAHRGRPAAVAAGLRSGPSRRRAAAALREGHPKLRPLHLLRHPFPSAQRRARVSGVLILGIGSPAGDDQAGWLVVDALSELGLDAREGVVLAKLDRPGANLVAKFESAEHVVLIDAMQSGELRPARLAGIPGRTLQPRLRRGGGAGAGARARQPAAATGSVRDRDRLGKCG